MTYRGKIEHGVVVLERQATIPEGTEVDVVPVSPTPAPRAGEALERLAGAAEDLPSDLAQRHDHYRREQPT